MIGLALDGETELTRRPADDEKFSALAFKIMTDPFVGTLAFLRVYSGVVKVGDMVLNSSRGKKERVGRLLMMHANNREDCKELYAGDIAAVVGPKMVPTSTSSRETARRR